jgi:hypothetical protein
MTTASYYLWKWADNNLPGKPNEVFAELLHGRMHPALQPFDAQRMLQDLQATAATRHALGEEWKWQVATANSVEHAHFLFLQCPMIPWYGSFREQFTKLVLPWGLSGYDEQRGNLIHCLLPKLNSFKLGGCRDEERFDIDEDDLPMLLGRVRPAQMYPWAELTNRNNHYVACYVRRSGFDVEWRENRNLADLTNYDHWRAGNDKHLGTTAKPRIVHERRVIDSEVYTVRMYHFKHEKLRYGDALRIFQAFLRGDQRPSHYHWRSIRQEEEQAKQLQQKEEYYE